VTGYLFTGRLDTSWAPHDLATRRPDLYETACAAAGTDPFPRAYDNTRFSEPALVALSLAAWRPTAPASPADTLVGCAAGEIAALAVAGAFSEADAIRLAAIRGRLTSDIASALPLAGLALHDANTKTARQLADSHDLLLATDDAPHELILSGRRTLVDAASRTTQRLGLTSCWVPRHRFIPAREFAAVRREWRAALHATNVLPPKLPVFSPATVGFVIDPRSALAEGLSACMRVRQAMAALARLGVRRMVPVGTSANTTAPPAGSPVASECDGASSGRCTPVSR
jgi:[acyl-carrier-protein] S-malonyltransferase